MEPDAAAGLPNRQVTISAALEPAYEIGGDAYDYALADSVLHLGLFDATGHDVRAGMTTNLAATPAGATWASSKQEGLSSGR